VSKCKCCKSEVRMMCETDHCGSLCRRGKCDHKNKRCHTV